MEKMAGAAFDEAVAEVVYAANVQRAIAPSDNLIRALNALADMPPQQRETARSVLANALAGLISPVGAGLLSIWLGAGVEYGAAPETSCQPIIDTFMKWSRTVETLTGSSN